MHSPFLPSPAAGTSPPVAHPVLGVHPHGPAKDNRSRVTTGKMAAIEARSSRPAAPGQQLPQQRDTLTCSNSSDLATMASTSPSFMYSFRSSLKVCVREEQPLSPPGPWTLDPGPWTQEPLSAPWTLDPGPRSHCQHPGPWTQEPLSAPWTLDPGATVSTLDPGPWTQEPLSAPWTLDPGATVSTLDPGPRSHCQHPGPWTLDPGPRGAQTLPQCCCT